MRIKRFLVLALAAAMLLSSAAMAAGNLLGSNIPTVVYDGDTGEFTLENAVGGDLFPNFKGVMPGDERAQDITLVTKNLSGKKPVAIYLTSTPSTPAEGESDPLEPLTLSVTRNGEAVGEFAHSVRENVPLGVFKEDGETTLHVKLTVPLTVGNELQDARASLRWDFAAQPDDVITITPASISSYVGGVSSNESGAPTLRFHVILPNGEVWDNAERPITMTLHQEGKDPITMSPRRVSGTTKSYYCFPTLERGLKFVDGEKALAGDYLTLTDTFDSDSGSRDGSYAVGLVNDPAWYITAVGDVSGRTYTVQVLPGTAKVYVRYVHDDTEMLEHPSSALTKVVSDPAKVNTIVDAGEDGIYRKAVAVIPQDAVYYTNGKDSGLGSFTMDQDRENWDEGDEDGIKPPLVALLFDDTVSLTDKLTDDAIEAKMIEHAGHAKDCGAADNYSFDGWKYNFRYLDLVNYNDGNAWVSTASPITIYWPYPEEALSDPGAYEYQILHYRKMSRSYVHKALADIDAWEAELLHNGEKGPVKIVKEELQYHEKEKGISFTLEYVDGTGDNFSPFVLMWRKKGDSGGGDDRPTPVPSATPVPYPFPFPPSPVPSPGASPLPSPGESGVPLPSPSVTQGVPSQGPVPSPGVTDMAPSPDPAASPMPGGSGNGGHGGGNGSHGTSSGGSTGSDTTLPQTGQQWWPVAVMAIGGSGLLIVGLRMGKKGKHEA